ncbi:MAG: penicillin-binding protein activator [Patescibacteria group bacterium]
MINLRTFGKVGFIAGFTAIALAGGCLSAPGSDTASTIKVGLLAPLTGDAAAYGAAMSNTIKLAAKQMNAQGGIQGKNVEVVIEDSQCDSKAGATAVQKMINTEKVQFVIGGLCSSETLGAAPFAEAAKVVIISPGSSSPKITTSGDYIFRNYPSDLGKGTIVAKIATNKGYKKVGVLSEQTDYALGLKDAFVEAFKAVGGESVVETYTSDATDLRTQLVKLREAKIDALFVDPQTQNKALLTFQQMKEMKWKVQMITQDAVISDKETLMKEKDFEEGMIGVDLVPRNDDPMVTKFRADYKAEYAVDPNFEIFSYATYDAMTLLKQGIEKGGEYNGTKLKDYLYTVKDFKGLLGTYGFDQNGDPTIEYATLVVKDGVAVAAPEILTTKVEPVVTAEVKKEEPKKEEAKVEEVKVEEVKVETKTETPAPSETTKE